MQDIYIWEIGVTRSSYLHLSHLTLCYINILYLAKIMEVAHLDVHLGLFV